MRLGKQGLERSPHILSRWCARRKSQMIRGRSREVVDVGVRAVLLQSRIRYSDLAFIQ